jgi:hypothetical protein
MFMEEYYKSMDGGIAGVCGDCLLARQKSDGGRLIGISGRGGSL